MKKSGAKKKNNATNPAANLFLFAISDASVQKKIEDFRNTHGINKLPFILESKEDAGKIQGAHAAFTKLIEELKLSNSATVRHHLWEYIIYGKIGTEEIKRYSIRVNPIIQIDFSTGKLLSYAESISLVTYAKLSPKEEKQALKLLRDYQKSYFPSNALLNLSGLENIENEINFEKSMKSRVRPRIKKQFESYFLNKYQDDLDKGKMSKWKFNEIKSMYRPKVEKIKTGHTSKDVAKEFLGSSKKDSTARQKLHRL